MTDFFLSVFFLNATGNVHNRAAMGASQLGS